MGLKNEKINIPKPYVEAFRDKAFANILTFFRFKVLCKNKKLGSNCNHN